MQIVRITWDFVCFLFVFFLFLSFRLDFFSYFFVKNCYLSSKSLIV